MKGVQRREGTERQEGCKDRGRGRGGGKEASALEQRVGRIALWNV